MGAKTIASGLRVPQAVGGFLILDAIRLSQGTAVSVTDEEMVTEITRVGSLEGLSRPRHSAFQVMRGRTHFPVTRDGVGWELNVASRLEGGKLEMAVFGQRRALPWRGRKETSGGNRVLELRGDDSD